jgi:hypothetical protein
MSPVLSCHLPQAKNNHRFLEDATSMHPNLDRRSNNKSYLVPRTTKKFIGLVQNNEVIIARHQRENKKSVN